MLQVVLLGVILSFILGIGTFNENGFRLAASRANNAVSWVINQYLHRKYPIRAAKVSIPTSPYQWPNGQGDIAKFLEGEEMSSRLQSSGKVYRIWSGMIPEIALTTPEDVKTVFRDSDAHLKAINNNAGWLMGEILGKCLGLVSGEEWNRIHASVASAFTTFSIFANISWISEMTTKFVLNLHVEGNLDRGVLKPTSDLRMLPFWISAKHIYGPLSDEQRDELQALIPLAESIFNRMIQGGSTRYSFSQYLPSETNRTLKKFKTRWGHFNDAVYERCAREGIAAPIVQMYDTMQNGRITYDQCLQTLHEMLFANLDVTIGGLAWNPLFLAANQDIQEQIREEIRKARADAEGTEDRWAEYLRKQGTLLAASILESARLKPAAAYSIPQSAPTSRLVGGFLIPAGTNFIVDTHALNIRNPYWGDDGAEYRPGRFMERKTWDMRYQYWRFGFGPRQCLGKTLADIILRVVVAYLVENYELSLMPGSTWSRNPQTWIAEPTTEIRCARLAVACDGAR